MNKPITAGVASFTGWSVATLAVSYFKHGEFSWSIAFVGGAAMGLGMYALAQWKQNREERADDS
ncbi:hypothetical protein FYK55_15125 [Roseiconus nitratireducens]|uniref:Uncharacterized protein n=1 Tax=Roseiconus nitratireducens TaxID=2605748 RepID=A0A5M6D8D0_9BACT|nr:hypothetical protein [Roseiconus nitratireducens]KAA5542139.1 hypothetical protein FYK55_15125 [Roseiconus nitratireducens]